MVLLIRQWVLVLGVFLYIVIIIIIYTLRNVFWFKLFTDLGRFADDFSLGAQFNTEAESGLLFYVFSRRREDKMAVQLNQSRVSSEKKNFPKYFSFKKSSAWV